MNKKIPLGIRLNNPFNIRYSANNNWRGKLPMYVREKLSDESSTTLQFERFTLLAYGVRAGVVLLNNYVFRKRLNTIRKVITAFAPSHENPTDIYIDTLSKRIGIGVDSEITDIVPLCREIVRFEQGCKYNPQEPDVLVFVGAGEDGTNIVLNDEDFKAWL